MPALTQKRKSILFVLAGVFVLYSLAGFVAVPMVIRHILENTAARKIQRQVTLAAVRFNPYSLTVKLTGLSVADDTGSKLLTLDQLVVNPQVGSVFRKALVLKSVILTSPSIHVVRTERDRFSFSDLLETRTEAVQTTPSAPDRPLRVIVDQFQLSTGTIRFDDHSLNTPFSTTLSSIDIALAALDTAQEAPPANFQLVLITESSEHLSLKGLFSPGPLFAAVEMEARGIDLAKYSPYHQPFWNARLARGRLDLKTTVNWSTENRGFADSVLKVTDLEINQTDLKAPLLHMPVFEIHGARIDLQAHTAVLGRVSSHGGTAWVSRQGDGSINWLNALQKGASTQIAPLPAIAEQRTAADNDAAPSGWKLMLPELSIDDYRIEYDDFQPAQPARLTLVNLGFEADALSTEPDTQGNVSLSLGWNDQGTLTASGQLGIFPLHASIALTIQDLDLRPLQPYVDEHVGLLVTSGRFNTQGELYLKSIINAAQETSTAVRYAGQASVAHFKSVDTEKRADFFNFESLFLSGLHLEMEPLRLSIEEVALTDFYNKVLIGADGTSNITSIFKTGRQANDQKIAANGRKAAPADIQIKAVTLQGGSIDFTDLNIKPSVHLPMEKLGGRISGLNAIQEHQADVLLEGRVRGNDPLKIAGKINPLIKPPYVDLHLNVTSVDLSPFTPYAEKYLGYELTKGLLSMDLVYLVEDNSLQGQNQAVLTQLTLGNAVPSPEATKLPIKLAIALLKDRQGNIDIDLPVKGDLDNPEFSIGGIVLKMLGNLILEIVTSPFKVLGALFGGGQELSYIDFATGFAGLSSENNAKLDSLAKLMFERPGLNLEIQGQFDPEGDSEGLRHARFEQLLKATKLKSMMAAGQLAIPLEQIAIADQERDRIVLQAYAAADFPKPRDEKGQEKSLPPGEMEKMLYTAIAISDDDLRRLANQRALATKAYLLQTGTLEPQRLFVLEPQSGGASDGGSQKSRVRFSLK